jgi:hypothetical protein
MEAALLLEGRQQRDPNVLNEPAELRRIAMA